MKHINTYTKEEYAQMQRCLRCGKLISINDSNVCGDCKSLKKCKICAILLREDTYKLYFNDIKNLYTPASILGKRKKNIREFEEEVKVIYPKHDENFCKDCMDLEKYVKNSCAICVKDFDNTLEHYEKHGNHCMGCINDFEFQYRNYQTLIELTNK